jgi:hypothetical protein
MGGGLVVAPLVILAAAPVRVDHLRVVVGVLVVRTPVLELAERPTGVVMRHVVVVVGVDDGLVGVLVLHVADDALGGVLHGPTPSGGSKTGHSRQNHK